MAKRSLENSYQTTYKSPRRSPNDFGNDDLMNIESFAEINPPSDDDQSIPLSGSSIRNLGKTQSSYSSNECSLGLLEHIHSDYSTNQSSLSEALKEVTNFEEAAEMILENEELREEIVKKIGKGISLKLKLSLKNSKLTDDKRDRNYLLSLNPHDLCKEFQEGCPEAFDIVTKVLLGLSRPEEIFESQYLKNNICSIYSQLARMLNRNASGYALYMGVIARDGGLREDSIKVFPQISHPRTLQKYDHVLAKNAKDPLNEKLSNEKLHFDNVAKLKDQLEELTVSESSEEQILAAVEKLKDAEVIAPKMLTSVWDNLNLRSNRRHERVGDTWEDLNFDFMTSIHINERVDANHLDNQGKAFKSPEDVTIEDFTPDTDELEFIFCHLVSLYSHSLLGRHPQLYKALKSAVLNHRVPHQFESEMKSKSDEYTGDIFEKSEVRTEDLISMLEEYQKEMVLQRESDGEMKALYRRQLSGDQKTEKNTHYAVLSKADEDSSEARLSFIIPGHEYFHFMMCLADVESELFRDNSRGLDGGAFSTATLLNRKKAKMSKGKDEIDALKDFINIKSQARFNQYFLSKFELDPMVDNTPDLLKSGTNKAKIEFLHGKVEEALRDLLPMFRKCSGKLPDMEDFPVKPKNNPSTDPGVVKRKESLNVSDVIPRALVDLTASNVVNIPSLNTADYLNQHEKSVSLRRTVQMYSCSMCGFESNLRSIVIAHIQECWKRETLLPILSAVSAKVTSDDPPAVEPCSENESLEDVNADVDKNEEKLKEDYFWNYKCCEFYIDSLFELSLNFEKFGNGAGMYIISKMMLPILYALGHSNYSNSVHRFICRVLSSTTPREAMLLVSERFSNREGKEGGNIFKDRRVEFRIRILKKLLSNMGPNINSESIQKVNSVIDIKEKLFHHAREVHGVIIRSGEHKERSELKDYQLIMEALNQMKADQTVPGRKFGGLTYPENLLDSDKFNKARFYRWLTQKNRDAVGVFRGSKSGSALPLTGSLV